MNIDQSLEKFWPLIQLYRELLNKDRSPVGDPLRKTGTKIGSVLSHKVDICSQEVYNRAKMHSALEVTLNYAPVALQQAQKQDCEGSSHRNSLSGSSRISKIKRNSTQLKLKPKRLVVNIAMCRYPIVKKIARYEFNLFMSDKDLFPNSQNNQIDSLTEKYIEKLAEFPKRDNTDDGFDIFWMDGAGSKHIERF